MTSKTSGFTLVELAIVLMIIGLLIGGILKGQELINNARITTTIRQMKNYDAAVITFQDSYGAKPGDISNPSTRLPNCGSAPCNIAGNNDGLIGTSTVTTSDENPAMWQHLAAANLVSGINTSTTWTAGTIGSASYPSIPFGAVDYIMHQTLAPNATYLEGCNGHIHYLLAPTGFGRIIPANIVGRMDQKLDDGKPWTGSGLIGSTSCGVAVGATSYDAGSTTACRFIYYTGF